MGGKRNYRIFTLDGIGLMKLCSRGGRRFDLNSQYDRAMILKDESKFAECALFYQIKKAAKDNGDRRSGREILTKSLVYLEFENGVADHEIEAKELLSQGFELKFKGDKAYTRFCPFDKSASMSRNNTISFIDEKLFDDVDKALDCGIDRSRVKLIPSKYYAYRGLYMTDGIAVEPDRLELNEKTVIVLKNKTFSLNLKNESAIGINNDVNENGDIEIKDSRIKWLDSYDVEPFDGEGLVCPEYSAIISREISDGRGSNPTSFQIRMPFTKGMLHTVYYRQFMEDYFKSDYPESLEVTDVFGIKRKLKDARIILTDSMFKCGKWLDKMLGIYEKADNGDKKIRTGFTCDPMKYYFENFHKYDHALYIANTDTPDRISKQIKMNYQFFNTLDLDKDAFEKLIDSHVEDTERILKDPRKGKETLLSVSDDEITDIDSYRIRQMEPWEYALKKNTAFVQDPMIKKRLRQSAKGRINDIFKGRIVVDGTIKYLSGDLLEFLLYLAKCCEVGTDGQEMIRHLRQFTLKNDRFYISGMSDYGMEQTGYYGMLRSPHLSRNEQCVLRPYKSTLYNKYFSHLKGVVMVSNLSTAPAAMAGADFDGDMVKIITNDVINEAIISAAYEPDPNRTIDSLGVAPLKRKLPISVISSPDGGDCYLGKHISYDDLKKSFASRVGIISNLAITMGKKEYAGASEVPDSSTALCTIATGLEIDSVKNGINPDIKYLQELCKKTADVYIDIAGKKKKIDSDKDKRTKAVHATYDVVTDEYTTFLKYNRKKKPTEDIYSISGNQQYNIDNLPYYYAKALYEKKATGRIKLDSNIRIPDYRFTFEQFENWREDAMKDPRIPKLRGYIGAYRRLIADAWNISRAESRISDETFRGRVITLLDVEYEKDVDVLMRSGEYIEEAMESAYQEVYEAVKTEKKADELLGLIEDLNWQYTMTFDEKAALVWKLLGTDDLSTAALEIICDRYDNGYQILNYILREVRNLRKLEALQSSGEDVDGEGDEAEVMIRDNWSRSCDKNLFDDIFGEYKKYYTRSDYTKTDWLDEAGERCRDKVLELFTYTDDKGNVFTDTDMAIQCTVALDKEMDEKHSFLWGVFRAEDFTNVIYSSKKGANNA